MRGTQTQKFFSAFGGFRADFYSVDGRYEHWRGMVALAPICPLTYREPNWSRLGTRWLHQSLPVRAATSNSRASGVVRAQCHSVCARCVRWPFNYASCWVHLHIPLLMCDAMHHELCNSKVPSHVHKRSADAKGRLHSPPSGREPSSDPSAVLLRSPNHRA